jgi:hypothetical protein
MLRRVKQPGFGVVSDGNRQCTGFPGCGQRRNSKGGSATGRDAYHHIVGVDTRFPDPGSGLVGVVFCAFGTVHQRVDPAGHQI